MPSVKRAKADNLVPYLGDEDQKWRSPRLMLGQPEDATRHHGAAGQSILNAEYLVSQGSA